MALGERSETPMRPWLLKVAAHSTVLWGQAVPRTIIDLQGRIDSGKVPRASCSLGPGCPRRAQSCGMWVQARHPRCDVTGSLGIMVAWHDFGGTSVAELER